MKIAADNNYEEIVEILREAIGEEIPDDVKLSQLSKAMYEDDPEKAKNKLCELLSSLSPELVRFKIIFLCENNVCHRWAVRQSMTMEVCFKTPSLKAK